MSLNSLHSLINRGLNGMQTITEMLDMYDQFSFYLPRKEGFKLTQAPERHTASKVLPVKQPFRRINRRMGRM